MLKVSQKAIEKFLVWLRNPLDGALSDQERECIEGVVRRRKEWVQLVWRYKLDQASPEERKEKFGKKGIGLEASGRGVAGVKNATPAKKGIGIFIDRPGGDGALLLYTISYELSRLDGSIESIEL